MIAVNQKKVNAIIRDVMAIRNRVTVDHMFVYHALDQALKDIGWAYADALTNEKFRMGGKSRKQLKKEGTQ